MITMRLDLPEIIEACRKYVGDKVFTSSSDVTHLTDNLPAYAKIEFSLTKKETIKN